MVGRGVAGTVDPEMSEAFRINVRNDVVLSQRLMQACQRFRCYRDHAQGVMMT
jgi:hypothetical protein